MIRVTFLIPNRDDAEKPPLEYVDFPVHAVPQQGDAVTIYEVPWVVKWVEYVFEKDTRANTVASIRVRLIEPNHWSQQ